MFKPIRRSSRKTGEPVWHDCVRVTNPNIKFGAPWPRWSYGGIRHDDSFEFISDDSSPRERGKREHSCDHYQRFVGINPITTFNCVTTSSGNEWKRTPYIPAEEHWYYTYAANGSTPYQRWGDLGWPCKGLPALYGYNGTGGLEVKLPFPVDTLESQAIQAMTPGIKEELSLINDVIELRDFKHLLHVGEGITGWKAGIQRLKRKSSAFWNQPMRKIARDLSRTSAGGLLQTEFNLKPLASSVAGLVSAIADIHRKVSNLVENAGKERVRHFVCPVYSAADICPNVEEVYSDTRATWYVGQFKAWRNVRYSVPEFHGTMRFRYQMPGYRKEEIFLRGLLDSVGVNCNPAIVWNALKFSFVVDWVVGVSRWLNQFKERNLEVSTDIYSFTGSIKFARNIFCAMQTNSGGTLDSGKQDVVRTQEYIYKRWHKVPNVYQELELSGLNPREFGLGSALVIARR